MTANERRFLELELKVWLRKMKREKVSRSGKREYTDWHREIEETASAYFYDIVYSGQGGYVLASEKSRLIAELQKTVTRMKVKEKLHRALFVEMDLERVKDLAYGLRGQVETIMTVYKSHVEKGNGYGQ